MTQVDMSYYKRTADALLCELLEAFGAVLIEGPKWCGKTTTARQIARSVIQLQDPDMRAEYQATALSKPSLLLNGETPRLIDEWQDIPVLWDAVRAQVDIRNLPGQFILTGSNAINKSEILHSGVGRIARMSMMPMSLWESQDSTGSVSLKELFDNPDYNIDGKTSNLKIEDLIFLASRGGWPASLQTRSKSSQLLIAKKYVQSLCEDDITRVDGKRRDSLTTQMILKSYARNISTLAKKKTLIEDILSSGEVSLSRDTFDDYEKALQQLFIIQNIEAWSPAIRSKTAIRSNPKRSFCDPSISVAMLGLSPDALSTQLRTFGFIFEQMCVRDLRAYTIDSGSHISYYHDRYGLEVDYVLHLDDGRYSLIECKLGSREIDSGAEHLLEVKRLIREHNKGEAQVPLREPDLLMVLTGGSTAYTRPDGVKVVPLGCLRD